MKENLKTILWILGLAALSVGARNFEEGLSLDAPLYATIARNIARTGEWFWMNGNIPDFVPFAEHPHGAFWLQALIFKILPAADWSVRIQGHLFYVLTLFLIYKSCARYLNTRVATLSVLLLWIWPVYSNFFSSFYLDPGAIFFGFLFLYSLAQSLHLKGPTSSRVQHFRNDLIWSTVAGLSLGLCFLFKGLTGLAFGIPAALLVFYKLWEGYKIIQFRKALTHSSLIVFICLGIVALMGLTYLRAIENSKASDFLDIYWGRQFSGRFEKAWTLSSLFNLKFWSRLLHDTHYLAFLVPFAIWKIKPKGFHLFSILSLLCFIVFYAPAQRIGSQYWILVFPPVAILIANLWTTTKLTLSWDLKKLSFYLSIGLVLLLQYLPIPTHKTRKPDELDIVLKIREKFPTVEMTIAGSKKVRSFIYSSTFTWYGDISVNYLSLEDFEKNLNLNTIVLQHEPFRPEESFRCRVGNLVLVSDGGMAVYAPKEKAPYRLARCLDSGTEGS